MNKNISTSMGGADFRTLLGLGKSCARIRKKKLDLYIYIYRIFLALIIYARINCPRVEEARQRAKLSERTRRGAKRTRQGCALLCALAWPGPAPTGVLTVLLPRCASWQSRIFNLFSQPETITRKKEKQTVRK